MILKPYADVCLLFLDELLFMFNVGRLGFGFLCLLIYVGLLMFGFGFGLCLCYLGFGALF